MMLQFNVPKMACSACSDKIANAVKAVDPSAIVQTDTKTKVINIETHTTEAIVRNAIATAGYTIAN